MGQFKQVLGLSIQNWLELAGLIAKPGGPFLSVDSTITDSYLAVLFILTSFLGSGCSGFFFRGARCLLSYTLPAQCPALGKSYAHTQGSEKISFLD